MSDRVIGIDLGTTFSCVAVVEGGQPVVVPNRGGYKTTPSIVAVTENGKRPVVQLARRTMIPGPGYGLCRSVADDDPRVGGHVVRSVHVQVHVPPAAPR